MLVCTTGSRNGGNLSTKDFSGWNRIPKGFVLFYRVKYLLEFDLTKLSVRTSTLIVECMIDSWSAFSGEKVFDVYQRLDPLKPREAPSVAPSQFPMKHHS